MTLCPWWPEVARTVEPGTDPRLRAHLEACGECGTALAQVRRAAAAIKDLPYQPPDRDAREQARTRLMATIERSVVVRPSRHPLWLKAAAAVTITLCGATVVAAVGARVFESRRELAPSRQKVAPVEHPAHRRVAVPVVVPTQPLTSAPLPEPAPPELPPRRPAPRPRRPPAITVAQATAPAPPLAPTAGPAERAFDQGWEAMRAGDHLAAAAQMERAIALGADGALDEDAHYWRAVALGRAGSAQEARAAMEEFLRHHPGSGRAGEVSAMLGWLLVDAGERARAEELFRAAAGDASPAVRRSGRAGIELIEASRR